MSHARWARVGIGAVAAATLGLGLAGTTAGSIAGAASGGVTVNGAGVLPGLAPLRTANATDLGPAGGTVHAALTLAGRDPAGLAAFLASGASLAPGQFAPRFGPTAAAVSAVTAWAASAGLSVDNVTPDGMLVDVSGPAATVGSAFGTTLHQFVDGSQSYVSPATTAVVPASIVNDLVAVVGLSTLSHVAAQPAAGVAVGQSFGPRDFWSFYNAPSADTGAGQTVAVLAEGDLTQVQKDLRQFESTYALPQAPVTVRTVDGASTDTSGQGEFDLDTQYSTGFAPDASLLLYDGRSLNDADIADEISAFVTDDAAKQGSFSAGECEVLADVAGFLAAADALLAEAQAQGQTLFTSSGDTGGFCSAVVGVNGVPAGLPNVSFPASSPHAIGVGGTTILNLPGVREAGWYAGGGGPSLLESQPSWQAKAGGSLLPVQRGVPDVALDADPNTVGYNVIVSGTPTDVGGTSAGAPSWNGIWARAQQAHAGALGFAGPLLYGLPASAFNDIVVGDNVPFPNTPGWDYVTGRGTPDISAVVSGA